MSADASSRPRRIRHRWLVVLAVITIGMTGWWMLVRESKSDIRTLSAEDIKARLEAAAPDSEYAVQLRALLEQDEGRSQAGAASAPAQFSGFGVSFSYPAAYTLRETTDEANIFVTNTGGTRRLVVSRKTLPGTFDEFSGVRLRRTKADAYQERGISINGIEAVEFTHLDGGFEKVLFIPTGGEVITIAVSSIDPFGVDRAQADYNGIVSTLMWD